DVLWPGMGAGKHGNSGHALDQPEAYEFRWPGSGTGRARGAIFRNVPERRDGGIRPVVGAGGRRKPRLAGPHLENFSDISASRHELLQILVTARRLPVPRDRRNRTHLATQQSVCYL